MDLGGGDHIYVCIFIYTYICIYIYCIYIYILYMLHTWRSAVCSPVAAAARWLPQLRHGGAGHGPKLRSRRIEPRSRPIRDGWSPGLFEELDDLPSGNVEELDLPSFVFFCLCIESGKW